MKSAVCCSKTWLQAQYNM